MLLRKGQQGITVMSHNFARKFTIWQLWQKQFGRKGTSAEWMLAE